MKWRRSSPCVRCMLCTDCNKKCKAWRKWFSSLWGPMHERAMIAVAKKNRQTNDKEK